MHTPYASGRKEPTVGETFGAVFRKYRLGAGKSMGDVARYLGVSVTFISEVERGVRGPFMSEKIFRLAHFLGVEPEPLLAAAAEHRGSVELTIGRSAAHQQTAVVLMRGWEQLEPEQLAAIQQIVAGGKSTGEGEG